MTERHLSTPRLITTAAPKRPDGIVLVLHGGRENGRSPVRANQLAVLRMVPIARRVAAAGRGRLAVVRVLDVVRGWNGADASPVADTHWAVEQCLERFGDLPVGLIGHSMGGRAALRAAGARNARCVVGLAPWLPPGEPTEQLRGRRVLIVHGSADRMTSPAGTGQLRQRPRRGARDAAPARRVRRGGGGLHRGHSARYRDGPRGPTNQNRPGCERYPTGIGRRTLARSVNRRFAEAGELR